MNITNQLINEFSEQLKAKLIVKGEQLKKETFTIEEIIEAVKLTASRMNDRDLQHIPSVQSPWDAAKDYSLL